MINDLKRQRVTLLKDFEDYGSEPPAIPFNFSSSLPYSPPSSEEEVEEEQMLTLEEQVQKYKKEREIEMAAIQSVEEEEESTEQFPDVQYLETFINGTGLSSYHGLGGVWEGGNEENGFYERLIGEEKHKITVSCRKRGLGRGGWSKHNPYLKPEYVEFEIEVDPTSIAQRLLKIREQVRKEIEHDLEVIGEWEGILLESWVESVKTGEEMVRLDGKALENDALQTAGQSPLRLGTFDLLLNLSTQHSVYRVLENSPSNSGSTFLKEYYNQRINWFNGPQKYNRAHDFIKGILETSPSISKESSGKTSILDTRMVAEMVLRERSRVAEWRGGEEVLYDKSSWFFLRQFSYGATDKRSAVLPTSSCFRYAEDI
ncbi:hypothetical protein TrLO_g6182 [Triparma laevis f. longispina]|uniref:Uncharacterized protein n=1 Tax=Triparma laevis f. longispina TaxID=1714387 RepID=A0A9W7L0V9_9STRA|nr:hypothetical protein TrLO_g6182 [Triparma laevis f. longispina]